jgi:DNA-binding CsgD family transcriptional regulator
MQDSDMVTLSEFSDLVSEIYDGAIDVEDRSTGAPRLRDAHNCSMSAAAARVPAICESAREHVLRLLASHAHQAAELNQQLKRVRLDEAGPSEVLDHLGQGVIITDCASRPLFVNRVAAEIIAEADGLRIDSAGLSATRAAETAAIRRMIAEASELKNARSCAGAVRVSRPSMRRPLAVLVAPLRTAPGWFVQRGPAAILLISDPERSVPVPPAYLQQFYGLTPAEAAVTVEVLRGAGLPAAAAELGITVTTVRTHLQHVFEKTQTRRQAELVRLIAESYSGLRLDGPLPEESR